MTEMKCKINPIMVKGGATATEIHNLISTHISGSLSMDIQSWQPNVTAHNIALRKTGFWADWL
jgi:uncharacterized protein YgfB (UPF0149 family)